MRVFDILQQLRPVAFHGNPGAPVGGIACDSRRVCRDGIFAAVRGEKHDGHDFLASAREGGAITVLSELPPTFYQILAWNWIQVAEIRPAMALVAREVHRRPDLAVPFVGITGTNGKTTLTYILEAIFRQAGRRPAVVGTVAYRFDGRDIPADRTTPEAPELLAFAREVADSGGGPLIMEVSAHSLSLHRVHGLVFDTAVFTNLTRDHLDYYPNLAAYADAKARLFDGRNGPLPRRAVFNVDDPFGREFKSAFRGEAVGTGTSPDADFRILAYDFDPPGLCATLRWDGRDHELAVPLTGRGNLHNVVQAVAAAVLAGVGETDLLAALAAMPPVPGRLEEVLPGHPVRVFVDYAHTEDALANACAILRTLTTGRLVVVFGCGGDRDRGKRPRMGRVVAEAADVVLVTSDNPRSEDPDAIIDEIVDGIRGVRQDFRRITDRRAAIGAAIGLARPGDTILIAGKGHERYQIIGTQVIPFSDYATALALLQASAGGRP
ncbi:MAG TPA: UDP-N-acetylmuramoyl-L-alanyl-D-glutamate--2,6-diaminopimelate ligase [Acidobacteriota bacterium]|jgi:UDP-N-acetylmuramoyl-L-alanyl-D-glutamate--2,6-diaminopimelate ligase|nr:UDP-N-acetylmuramoyl-L-alanyl-D-glutamate--2,6-diaminopimelate ligase [Acidobacteriota bacterium]HNR38126.1 UDP-N-acetylmuramoyl-L-alanyl-D-glutamate--2,6-diaminopimelate ligase [Acidobacteriota bacterium]HNU00661.1 UDP-N-acetylmuramoyl-L-alanyl-D-glutamate--2,6-diaminopimelate ligase [Acidobacteriota bacterium]HPB26992.1 UDP-N-acetylmuramoyl-L-alanyl-D-glutamate--2,6-diaminopimelate ligase [Acidobacteriota bacterium]HQO24159.1 UDP-N-acetylmuramoyl-L-alanyl-D-glutamate--2,6-diaminopimelate l